MGNSQSMFSVDPISMYDRLLQNDPFLNSGFNKMAMEFVNKETYGGIRRNYGKFFDEKVRLQTGKWWNVLF